MMPFKKLCRKTWIWRSSVMTSAWRKPARSRPACAPIPVLTVSGDHLDLLGTHYDAINNAGPNEYSVRTDFVLERAGKREKRMALGAVEPAIAELGVQDAMRKVVFEVQSAFVDVLLAKEHLALAQDNLKSLNGIVQVNT